MPQIPLAKASIIVLRKWGLSLNRGIRIGKLIAGGATVNPVINPTRKGMNIAISQRGTPLDDKAPETAGMALEDSRTSLNPITAIPITNRSILTDSLSAFQALCLSIR